MSSDLKFKVLSKLLNGEKAKEIAMELGVSSANVLRWERELTEARRTDTLDQLINLDDVVLDSMSALLPTDLGAGELIEGVKGLRDILEADLQIAAQVIINKVKSGAMSVDSIGELEQYTEILCNLQNAFFNKNSTQVLINNDYGQGTYSSFLSDQPSNNLKSV